MNNIINGIETDAKGEYIRQYGDTKPLGQQAYLLAYNITAVAVVGPAKIKCRVQAHGDVLQIFLEE